MYCVCAVVLVVVPAFCCSCRVRAVLQLPLPCASRFSHCIAPLPYPRDPALCRALTPHSWAVCVCGSMSLPWARFALCPPALPPCLYPPDRNPCLPLPAVGPCASAAARQPAILKVPAPHTHSGLDQGLQGSLKTPVCGGWRTCCSWCY